LADTRDALWTKDQMGDAVVHYQEIHAGHLTFMVGKDMSYWTQDAMKLLKKYQPLPVTDRNDVFLQ